jgi:aspartyl-tRNA synthetase
MYQMQKVYQDTFDMRYDTLLEYIFIDIERGFNIQALHNAKLIPIMDEYIHKMAVKMV